MSYNYPYQNYQPTYQPSHYPPPPPPRTSSSGPSYDAGQQPPALPPRPSPTPGSPTVQDVTAGFGRLSTYDVRPQTYVPHADYHQAAASPAFTWPTDHGASVGGGAASNQYASPNRYASPPPPALPPRPQSQSPWQAAAPPWQTPQSPAPPSFPSPQPWQQHQQPPPPWSTPPQWSTSNQPTNPQQPSPMSPPPQWQQQQQQQIGPSASYSRPPPPPPAELQQPQQQQQQSPPPPPREYRPPCNCSFRPGQCPAHPAVSSPVSPASAGPPTPASSRTSGGGYSQYSQQQQQQQQTYYPPPPEPGSGNGRPEQSSNAWSPAPQQQQGGGGTPVQRKPVASPPAFVFEMEGSVPGGVADAGVAQKKGEGEEEEGGVRVEEVKKKEEAPAPDQKLQRTFTDTLRQAGPYFYVPPAVTVEDVEEEEEEEHAGETTAVQQSSGSSASGAPQQSTTAPQEPPSMAQPPAASTVQLSQSTTAQKQPLEGAESFGYFLKIPNPPTNIPADQAANYSVLYKCEYPVSLDYADLFWFHHVDIPDFHICGHCFERHIRQTEFAHGFTGKIESMDLKLACQFGAPRMLQQLWPQAVRTHNLHQVESYMRRRTEVTKCHGPTGVLGKDATHVRWFKMRGNEIPELLICEACLEDEVLGTAFNEMFVPYLEPQGQEQRWSCDMSLVYLRRAFAQALKTHNWSFFVTPAANRLKMPACAGPKGVEANTRQWYTPTRHIEGVVICEACYDDNFALTELESFFSPRPVSPTDASNLWSCDFTSLGVRSAFEVARMTSSPTPLHTVLQILVATGPCAAGPLASRTWYKLAAHPSADFDICPTCHAGLFAAFPNAFLSHLLVPITTAQPTARVCDFSAHAPRFLPYANRYLAAVNQPGKVQPYVDHVARFSSIPACARRDPVRNGRWFLLNGAAAADLVACLDCHAAAIEGTPLAHLLAPWPPGCLTDASKTDPVPRVCDMYSAAMRARWQALCHAPDDADALAAFVAFSRHRHRVYEQTVPRCKELLAAAKARAERQRVANAMSSAYHGMALASGGYGGYGGYGYGGGGGVFAGQAAAAGAQGVALMMEGMGDTEIVRELEGRWVEVE